jgi:hypothetical protein
MTMSLPSARSRRFTRAFRLAAVAAALSMAGLGAAAQDLGPLTPQLQLGAFAPWMAQAEGTAYVLSNTTDPSAVTYFWVGNPAEEGRRTIAVDVDLREGAEGSGAGLLYGFQEEPRSYFLLMLRPGGTVALVQRTPEGFEERMGIGGDQVKPGINRLEIRERGKEIDILLNGTNIGAIGNDLIGRGGVGIVATGTGTFAFSNFALTAQ